MHSMDNYYVSKLIPLMVEAQVHAIPNPLINIMLQGRHDSYPKRRGQTRVPQLRDAGITVGFGSDCVMDPWYSLGRADMLDVAAMGLHVGQLSSRADMEWCFDAVTVNSAAIMGLNDYGVAKGKRANMVLLQAQDPIEAIRLRAHRLAVIRDGKVIARSTPIVTDLNLPNRPGTLNAAEYAPRADNV
jgi:cytosine deaminase